MRCKILCPYVQRFNFYMRCALNTRGNMVLANGKIITLDIETLKFNPQTYKYDIKFKKGGVYSYNYNSVTILKKPIVLNPSLYTVIHLGRELFDIAAIYVFTDGYNKYWHICFGNGSERDYVENELTIIQSCLTDEVSNNVFSYLKETANYVSIKSEDGTKLLSKQYEKISGFIREDTTLAAYLNPKNYKPLPKVVSVPIFPFGCNSSQYYATKTALENKISVIQGPPGTGKTQTILNIIANLLLEGKTVQVVSNNNSATANVLEKLSNPKYGMGFLVASLGCSKNKQKFLKNQTGNYPDLSTWKNDDINELVFRENIKNCSIELETVFNRQERLAKAKSELRALRTEKTYFEEYKKETWSESYNCKFKKKLTSEQILKLWNECQDFSETDRKISWLFKIKSRLIYGISKCRFYTKDISKIITLFQDTYYKIKEDELVTEINDIENYLKNKDAEGLIKELCDKSMALLRSLLFKKYGNNRFRKVFDEEDLWKNCSDVQYEYPIVLSTTFSSRSSLGKKAVFDYVIVDEASQVDVATGALALSSAKNVVIVGDSKQLSNVVSNETKELADVIFDSYSVNMAYKFSKYSFLESVCEIIPSVPQTLLREHYRCHPKIIGFCNQKFYGGQLVIMTEDNNENDTLSVVKTVKGNHAREHFNQRQVDVIVDDVLPNLKSPDDEIGIIAPYNNQVDAISSLVDTREIDVATVHKFQGREKDAIVISTVDDEITDFVDDPDLLNVAVSRAKKQLVLVVTGNEIADERNIKDLISYVEYNNYNVEESEIYSVFDFLYKQYTESRLEYLKNSKRISEYDSENLMYKLITEVLAKDEFIHLDVICHQPLNMLVRDPKYLNDEQCVYAMNKGTHLDFLIYNRISKKPILAIEVDGYEFHKKRTKQAARDVLKNQILEIYHIPLLRFATNGSKEKEKLIEKLKEIKNI